MTRAITRGAVVLIVLGVITLAGPTFGFSTIAADRAVAVAAAPTYVDGFLGIEENEDVTLAPADELEADVLRLVDNGVGLTSTTDVDITLESFDGEGSVEIESVTDDGDGFVVRLVGDCEGSSTDESGTVTFDIVASGDMTVSLTYETAPITLECADDGDITVNTGNEDEYEGGEVTTGGNLTVESSTNELDTGGNNITVGNQMTVEGGGTGGGTDVRTGGGDIVVGGDLTIENGVNEINTGGGNLIVEGNLTIEAASDLFTEGGDIIVGGDLRCTTNSHTIDTAGGSLTVGGVTEC